MVKLQPLGNRLLVRLKPLPAYTGRIIRVSRNEAAREALVVAVGPLVRDTREGQTVLINPLAGTLVGDEIILPEGSVLAYISGGKNGDNH